MRRRLSCCPMKQRPLTIGVPSRLRHRAEELRRHRGPSGARGRLATSFPDLSTAAVCFTHTHTHTRRALKTDSSRKPNKTQLIYYAGSPHSIT